MTKAIGVTLLLALPFPVMVGAQQASQNAVESAEVHPTVIVPWTHFGRQALDPPQTPEPPQSADPPNASGVAALPATVPQQAGEDSPPLTEISELTSEYQKRVADRDAKLEQFRSTAGNETDPDQRALADIGITRVRLEGARDRMQSSQKLSQALSALAANLRAKADDLASLTQSRRSELQGFEDSSSRLEQHQPALHLALKNLALLPATARSGDLMQQINAEIAKDAQTLHANKVRGAEVEQEIKTLEGESAKLRDSAQRAEDRAAQFALAARNAEASQAQLRDHLEVSQAGEQAEKLLAATQNAFSNSADVADDVPSPPIPETAKVSESSLGPDRLTAAVRECVRKTGDPAECRRAAGGTP